MNEAQVTEEDIEVADKPISKLKSDRAYKAAKKRSKKDSFRWLDVHNTINLVSEQLATYQSAIYDINNQPDNIKRLLDKNTDFTIQMNTLARDIAKYYLDLSNIINSIPNATIGVTEATHMSYLDAYMRVTELGDNVTNTLMPVLANLNLLVTEIKMQFEESLNN